MTFYDEVNTFVNTADTWVWYVAFVLLIGFGIYATCRTKGVTCWPPNDEDGQKNE